MQGHVSFRDPLVSAGLGAHPHTQVCFLRDIPFRPVAAPASAASTAQLQPVRIVCVPTSPVCVCI